MCELDSLARCPCGIGVVIHCWLQCGKHGLEFVWMNISHPGSRHFELHAIVESSGCQKSLRKEVLMDTKHTTQQ